jgi:hypothetical protein
MEHEHGAFKVNRDIAPSGIRPAGFKNILFSTETLLFPRCDAKYLMPEI